ncbi:MAG: YggS family pyridoxal phosphate enzyme [Treponema sp. CETP13]|nr:MAG: YggS family pyridoxal phosphate enzyme [Treponema sp. CETP13]
MTNIAENYKKIRQTIDSTAEKVGRNPADIKLMAVSKFHTVDEIRMAIKAGATLFGENRVQEALKKFPELLKENKNIELELIGQLQSNKVKQIVPYVSCIQSVDRIKLLQEIQKRSSAINQTVKVLFEVHTGEESKSGFTNQELLEEAIEASKNMSHIIPCGFMTMAPFTTDKNIIRDSFKHLKTLSIELQQKYPELDLHELSMGMSNDFQIAIEEGSTLVRIGTALFGSRNYSQ